MKRVLSLVLALSMVMSMFTFSFAGLKDVEGTNYEAAVEALIELGVVAGYPDGTYLPEKTVSRAEMAKLLVIAAGLEPAAEVAVGSTRFSDVDANHWACGYINVAAEYGYIAGYPEGTFKPDAEVKYSEAVTMALRVLGYRTVVEAKGTWPTNYIAKAQDLEMLDGVTYGTYSAGATRGNVAILIWNMLKTEMWDVKSESEGDGLNYSTTDAMLNVKFPDYSYSYAMYEGFEINADGEVEVNLGKVEDKTYDLDAYEYEYLANDFYTFVPGTEVEVLVNEEDATLLTMVKTGSDKLFEASKLDFDEEYDELSGDAYHYAYARIARKAVKGYTTLLADSTYVYEISTSNKNYVKFNDDSALKFDYDDMEVEVILKDGERATIEDVEVGDILTEVTVAQYGVDENGVVIIDATSSANAETFYVIDSSEVEGKLTKVVNENFDVAALGQYAVATIAKEEYSVAKEAIYFEDPEELDDVEDFNTWKKAMNGEEVVAVLDHFGRVTAVLFDGEINEGDSSDELTTKFYALLGEVERDGSTYSIAVSTEDGNDELVFADKTVGSSMWKAGKDLAGYFAIATLNDEGELEYIKDYNDATEFMINADFSGEVLDGTFTTATLVYNEDGDEYEVIAVAKATFEDDDNLIIDDQKAEKAEVDSDTVVVTLIYDDKGTDKKSDDEYRVEYSEGYSEIESLKDDPAVIIRDTTSAFNAAKYVVIFDEVSTREDDLLGIVADVSENEIGEWLVTVADTRITDNKELKEAKKDAMILAGGISGQDLKDNYQAIMYSKEENKDGEYELTFVNGLTSAELVLGSAEEKLHGYVSGDAEDGDISSNGRSVILQLANGSTQTVKLDSKADKDIYDEYTFIIAKVEVDDDDVTETEYLVESLTEVDYEDVTFKQYDRVSVEDEIVLIIRGMDARK